MAYDQPMKKFYRSASVPAPPPMDMWYGAESGPAYERSITPSYNPIEQGQLRKYKQLRIPATRTDTNWRQVDAAVSKKKNNWGKKMKQTQQHAVYKGKSGEPGNKEI